MSNNSINEWTIEKEFDGLRVDYWLKKKFSNLSYPSICKIIRKGQVRVNKKRAKNSLLLNTGDKIKIYKIIRQEKKNIKIKSEFNQYLRKWIIFKNKELIVLNKPSGIAVQGGSNIKVNIDLSLDSLRFGSEERPKLVHRIDKKTSGLLLIARSLKCAKFLGEAFKQRKIKKKYLLIAKGLIKKKNGKINMPIFTNKKENDSITTYTLISQFKKTSLILASPLTGRKHQIRKHFSIIGHPIIGDEKFGTKDGNNFFLHSFYIEFENENKRLIKLFAPIPEYFKEKISVMNVNIEKIKEEIKKNIL
ncbi:MAG: hypothetical protein CL572_06740 [Alphaproteobacteria bacterium]|nr:hypothetical protein [Alphaproteobacteria bacterium]